MDQGMEAHRRGVLALTVMAVVALAGWARAEEPPVCATCHADLYEGMAKARHGNAEDARTPFGSGRTCEACLKSGSFRTTPSRGMPTDGSCSFCSKPSAASISIKSSGWPTRLAP